MKHVICYSGGHSSALTAVEVTRKYGKENVILLNHNISSEVEHDDIKRFKQEVADYLGIKITYANMDGYEEMTPLRVTKSLKALQFSLKPKIMMLSRHITGARLLKKRAKTAFSL